MHPARLRVCSAQLRLSSAGVQDARGFVELDGEEKTPWDILTEMNEDWWQTAIYERRCGSDNLLGTSIKYIDPEKACDGYPPDTPDRRAEPASKQSRRSSGADVHEVETAGCSAYCTGCKGCKGPEWTDAAAETTSKLSSNTRTSNTSRARPTAAPKTRPIPAQEPNRKDSSKVVPVPTSWPQSRWAPLEPNQTMLDIALRTNWRDFADAESSITGRRFPHGLVGCNPPLTFPNFSVPTISRDWKARRHANTGGGMLETLRAFRKLLRCGNQFLPFRPDNLGTPLFRPLACNCMQTVTHEFAHEIHRSISPDVVANQHNASHGWDGREIGRVVACYGFMVFAVELAVTGFAVELAVTCFAVSGSGACKDWDAKNVTRIGNLTDLVAWPRGREPLLAQFCLLVNCARFTAYACAPSASWVYAALLLGTAGNCSVPVLQGLCSRCVAEEEHALLSGGASTLNTASQVVGALIGSWLFAASLQGCVSQHAHLVFSAACFALATACVTLARPAETWDLKQGAPSWVQQAEGLHSMDAAVAGPTARGSMLGRQAWLQRARSE
ncbi:unnamed protein product [Polarella glacialis]|uniref:Uncharacterized protein n=1 Tax=Polarella glacialis TaxID=89957 RepID=A0A813EM40_POLGL|nr:unnamed protein product [Polarella glacialis]